MMSMKTAILLVLLSAMMPVLTVAQESYQDAALQRFQEANEAYSQRDYETSRDIYLDLVEDGHHDARLYFNLGNAEFRSGELGRAILWYERALRLDPRNEDVRRNLRELEQSRDKGIQEPESNQVVKFFTRIRETLSVNEWAYLALALFFAAGFFFVLKVTFRSPDLKVVLRNTAILFVVFCLFSGANAASRAVDESRDYAVVVSNDISIYSGLDQVNAEPKYLLGEGWTVELLREQIITPPGGGDDQLWVEVAYKDQVLGWTRGERLERI